LIAFCFQSCYLFIEITQSLPLLAVYGLCVCACVGSVARGLATGSAHAVSADCKTPTHNQGSIWTPCANVSPAGQKLAFASRDQLLKLLLFILRASSQLQALRRDTCFHHDSKHITTNFSTTRYQRKCSSCRLLVSLRSPVRARWHRRSAHRVETTRGRVRWGRALTRTQ